MAKARTLVGLDVHARKVVAAVLDAETGELAFFSMTADIAGVAGFCAGLPGPVRAAYEAGPTGYGLARELARRPRRFRGSRCACDRGCAHIAGSRGCEGEFVGVGFADCLDEAG